MDVHTPENDFPYFGVGAEEIPTLKDSKLPLAHIF